MPTPLAAQVSGDIQQAAQFALRKSLAKAVKDAENASNRYLGNFVKAFNSSSGRGRDKRIEGVNARAVALGQQVMADSYQSTKIGLSSYRSGDKSPNERYSGGKLLNALLSPEFSRVGASTVDFGVVSHLDKEARQWARLNYGAGKPGREPAARVVNFLGGNFAAFTSRPDPGTAFKLPEGFFSDQAFDSSNQKFKNGTAGPYFYPTAAGATASGKGSKGKPFKASPPRMAGIAGRGFIEDGINAFAKHWGEGMNQLVEEWMLEAGRGMGPLK